MYTYTYIHAKTTPPTIVIIIILKSSTLNIGQADNCQFKNYLYQSITQAVSMDN